jgi:prepilin-type N-terminal cleavage/methylation domain-containing protein
MKTKGFTLIELLVVVAIIGILAAVGVVAYSGYTSGAKKNSLISRQKLAVNFLMSEFQKCNIGQQVYLNNDNSFDQCTRILNPAISTTKNLAKVVIKHFNNINDWKNVYNTNKDGAVEGNLKSCELGAICVGGYVAEQILIVINYDDDPNNYVSSKIKLDY